MTLGARGNTGGINTQLSPVSEQLASTIHSEMGEKDGFAVYPVPDVKILDTLRRNRTRSQQQDDLPTELEYHDR